MIIFINGAFGVGKTTLAEMLVQRISNSLLFDPEIVGFFLRAIVSPIETFDDFQDLPMWRPLVVTTAQMLLQT
ncbi:MAG: AAA family ATPase, partial [Chloroflexota bacterium]|nr:AAA family ATPase [Chloroflexota bacterium]